MKKINFLMSAIVFTMLIAMPLSVSAKSNAYFTTENGYELTETEYNNLLHGFDKSSIYLMDDEGIELYKNGNFTVTTDEKYYETESNVLGSASFTREVSKSYAETKSLNSGISTKGTGSASHQTTYKKITLKVVTATSGIGYQHDVTVDLLWLKRPTYESYDVFGIRCIDCGVSSPGSYYRVLKSTNGGSSFGSTLVSGLTGNTVVQGTGVGVAFSTGTITANKTVYRNTVRFLAPFKPVIYATYQHAQGNISAVNAINFSIPRSGGYGNVLQFNTTTGRNLYDQMGGVQVQTR